MPCSVSTRLIGMQVEQARQRGQPLVPLGVVLHRARAERIEVRVDRHVQRREVREVPHHVQLGQLRQRRRRVGRCASAGSSSSSGTLGHVARRQPRAAAAGLARVRTAVAWLGCYAWAWPARRCDSTASEPRPGRRSLPRVRFSVTATRKQSASSGYQRPSGTPAKIARARRPRPSSSLDVAVAVADDELLERRPPRTPARSGPSAVEPLGGVVRLAQAQLGRLAQALRAQRGQVDAGPQGEQALVGADVARGLFAADVLLAGLQRQHPAALAAAVDRLAGDAARHAADELLRGRP